MTLLRVLCYRLQQPVSQTWSWTDHAHFSRESMARGSHQMSSDKLWGCSDETHASSKKRCSRLNQMRCAHTEQIFSKWTSREASMPLTRLLRHSNGWRLQVAPSPRLTIRSETCMTMSNCIRIRLISQFWEHALKAKGYDSPHMKRMLTIMSKCKRQFQICQSKKVANLPVEQKNLILDNSSETL